MSVPSSDPSESARQLETWRALDLFAPTPEHAMLADQGRIQFTSVTDDEALHAFHRLSELEGIIPALESSHAVAWAMREAPSMDPSGLVLINLSGRGDKDVRQVAALEGEQL